MRRPEGNRSDNRASDCMDCLSRKISIPSARPRRHPPLVADGRHSEPLQGFRLPRVSPWSQCCLALQSVGTFRLRLSDLKRNEAHNPVGHREELAMHGLVWGVYKFDLDGFSVLLAGRDSFAG
eukprot:6267948-Amphidinium_carterae.1